MNNLKRKSSTGAKQPESLSNLLKSNGSNSLVRQPFDFNNTDSMQWMAALQAKFA